MISDDESRNEDEGGTDPYTPGTHCVTVLADRPVGKVKFVCDDIRHKDSKNQDSKDDSEDEECRCNEACKLELEPPTKRSLGLR